MSHNITPENEPFNLFVEYNRETQRETWFNNQLKPRFSIPMIELLDEYPVGSLFEWANKGQQGVTLTFDDP